ncbi:MAG: AMIN domain-containing protein [Firmicutes bacterium]|nr:AMIN domain-containing protein [Bacillota bacterium]
MMKRILSLIIVFVMILGIFTYTYASDVEYVNVKVDGEVERVKKINVLVNGEPIKSDVPPVLYNERTLVPVRFVANYLNADIKWNGEDKEVYIKTALDEILLTIDSSDVIINGEKRKISYNVPAKIINDRTMVPLRFVSEALGFKVGWDQSTWTGTLEYEVEEITDIEVVEDEDYLPKIIVSSTGEIGHKEIYLEEPYRLVIDIPTSKIDKDLLDGKAEYSIDVDEYPIEEIRAGQFKENPAITRVVIDLERFVGYNIKDVKDNKLEISFTNRVVEFKKDEIDNREAIIIENTNLPEYNIMRLSNPDRIVLDFMDSILESDKSSIDIETDFIKGIRTSQFSPDSFYNENDKIVRAVLDVKALDKRPNFSIETDDEDIIVYVDNEGFENISYKKEDIRGFFEIDLKKRTNYEVEYNDKSNIMSIKVRSSKIDVDNGMILIDDSLVDNMVIENSGGYKNIDILFKNNISYDVDSRSRDDEIEIEVVSKSNKYNDKLIVIDPGHGGSDPGAISPTEHIYEKILTLKVAKYLKSELESLGFNTLMTRDSDEFVGLYDRSDIANNNNADAFISIHFNAHDNPEIDGIQTLYCPAYYNEEKLGDNYPFAETVHNNLLETLGLFDRDIKRRPKLVVTRETKMVAALAELGFLTNPEDEKIITTDEYYKKAAKALANATVEYFK